MAEQTKNSLKSSRKRAGRDPERSRLALIEATLDTLAEEGLSDTSVSRIIARAGVSRGMIHLHFGGKDNLIGAAAELFANRYFDEMECQMAPAAGDPVATILAIIRADLGEALLNERSVAIWHALRGAARRNPAIALHSDTRDRKLRKMIFDSFCQLDTSPAEADAYRLANDATLGTLALLEGMWTDFMVHPEAFSRQDATRIILRFINGLYSETFSADET